MPFQFTIASGIAIATAVFLGLMAVHNQRSGWRRERSNTLLDVLMTWAQAKQEMRMIRETPVTAAGAPAAGPVMATLTLSSQLTALNAALILNAGLSPAGTPVQTDAEPASRVAPIGTPIGKR